MADPKIHVLIVGAGCCGLAIAHGLQKEGISYDIFEQEPSADHYRPREWSMGLHWSAPLLRELLSPEMNEHFNEMQNNKHYVTPPDEVLRIYDGRDASVVKEIPTPDNHRCSRRKMRAYLAKPINVQYDHDFESVETREDGVEVKFAGGKSAKGTILVGTDGAYSKVREALVGKEEAQCTPVEISHAGVAYNFKDADFARKLRALHPSYCMAIGPKGFHFIVLQDAPDDNDPLTWTFGVINSWLGPRPVDLDLAGRWKLLNEFAEGFAEPFRSATLRIPDDTPVTFDRIGYWSPKAWDDKDGRLTLSGDAAHPMSPYRGQGLNHALQSAYNFVQAVKKIKSGEKTRAEAIAEYEAEMIPRGVEEVKVSNLNTYMLLDFNQFLQSPLAQQGIGKGGH